MLIPFFKNKLRRLFSLLGIDATQNIRYDRLTEQIIKKTMKSDSIGIDVGCHKGEILDHFIKYAPDKGHYGFEPLPNFFHKLSQIYGKKHVILPYALSDTSGKTTFNYVKNAPAYSGIRQRKYDIAHPEIEQIDVEVRRLDDIIPSTTSIALIKIDVEGGEMGVLKGSMNTIQHSKPIVLFEFGLGASDVYGTTPLEMFTFFETMHYQIFLLQNFNQNSSPLSLIAFEEAYRKKGEYYFVACPDSTEVILS